MNRERAVSDDRVRALALSPGFARDGVLFAGTGTGGVLRSTDGGESWQQVKRGVTAHRVRAVAVSPAYESDGSVFFGTSAAGVLRSIDGGESWEKVNQGLNVASSQDFIFSGHLDPGHLARLPFRWDRVHRLLP